MAAVGFDLVGGCGFLGHEAVEPFGKKLSEAFTTGENLILVFLASLQAASSGFSLGSGCAVSEFWSLLRSLVLSWPATLLATDLEQFW